MAEENERPPTVPTVFDKPMAKCGRTAWSLGMGSAGTVKVGDYGPRGFYAEQTGVWHEHGFNSLAEAALAIESRLRSLVLSLVPMLDEATKAEVGKLCFSGINVVTLQESERAT